VTRIGELETALAVTSNNVVPNSLILITLMMEALRSSEMSYLRRATWRNIPEDGRKAEEGRWGGGTSQEPQSAANRGHITAPETELQECSYHNHSELFSRVCRVRILVESQTFHSAAYMLKTLTLLNIFNRVYNEE
jgi:hypothetical protein